MKYLEYMAFVSLHEKAVFKIVHAFIKAAERLPTQVCSRVFVLLFVIFICTD